ncbi:c-type cytochrome biogenesis protein CcsB [Micromonospora chalcea]|nr:c-type cytochrome biogenesis protein CcsB [Micromonospora chalcea]
MSALSDQLVAYAILVYLIAMISHAVEFALGNARKVPAAAPARELVGAGVGGDAPRDHRAQVHVAADRMPWGNMYEFVLTGTWIGVAAWLVVLWKQPWLRRLGLFLTLVMVLLLAFAELKLYVPIEPLMPALQSWWFIIHVSTIIFASGLFLLGVVPAAAYLMRAGWEQGRRSFPYTLARRLPAAAGLERLTFTLHAFSFPIFTFAVIAGAIWAEAAWGRAWGWDPKETWAFISWVVYAGYLHARATPSVKRNVATWISIVGFLTVMMNLFGVNFFFTGLHSYAGV